MKTRYPQGILISCEIPWDENAEFMEATFREEVRAVLESGFRHMYIFGTAGEGYAVTLAQFDEIVGVFHEETTGVDILPMVGIIGMSTPQVVERISHAYDAGFRMFQISLPPWGTLEDEEYMTFFRDVCGSFPDSRFLHYNLPRTGRVLLGPDYRRLVDEVPNLVATKNTRSDVREVIGIASASPELQHFYGEAGFGHGCLIGECSLLSSFGPMFPRKTFEFFEHGVAGRWVELFPMQAEYVALIDAFLVPTRSRSAIDGAYDKMIVRASGIDMPLRLLSPYRGFDEETLDACVKAVRQQFPEWY
jgi:dihydrodipicolinate synthase/N-acetylneuraminate lyase